jgi:hypothetical protein
MAYPLGIPHGTAPEFHHYHGFPPPTCTNIWSEKPLVEKPWVSKPPFFGIALGYQNMYLYTMEYSTKPGRAI